MITTEPSEIAVEPTVLLVLLLAGVALIFGLMRHEGSKTYHSDGQRTVRVVGAISACGLIITFLVVLNAWIEGPLAVDSVYECAALWLIMPPLWFWYEFFWIYDRRGKPGTIELFKHGQQVSIAIWAGVGLCLGGLATSDHFKEPKHAAPHCVVRHN